MAGRSRFYISAIAVVAILAATGYWSLTPPSSRLARDDSGLFPFEVGGKYGYMDRSGRTVIPAQFDGAYEFTEGLAAVTVGTKFGFIDVKGDLVVTPQFEEVSPFSQGLAAVRVGTKFGFIDTTGLVAIPPQFDEVNDFQNGRAAVKLGGGRSWDGRDKKVGHVSGNRYGFIDRKGKYIGTPGLLFVQSSLLNEFGWSGDATLVRTDDDRIGIMDSSGEIAVVAGVDEVGWAGFADGLAPAATGGRWGYVDTSGEWAIAAQFEHASGFKDGLAAVKVAQRTGLIDRRGKFVVNPQYDSIFGISEGFAIFTNGTGTIPGCPYCSVYGFINTQGQVVVDARFVQRPDASGALRSPVAAFSEGLAAVKTDDGWGFIDHTGSVVIEPQFDDVRSFKGGLAFVTVLGKNAYITKSGAFVVDPFPGTSVKTLKERNFTDVDQFFAAFKRVAGTKDIHRIADFVDFPFEQQMNMMTRDEFIAHYQMGNDELRILLDTPSLTKYEAGLGYGINNAAFAMTFKRDRDGYWRWVSIYYGGA